MVHLIDTTLREGEQSPGVLFSPSTRRRIIKGLIGVGVDEIELGVVTAKGRFLESLCDWMRQVFPQQSFSLWCRCRAEDIHLAAQLRPSLLALSIPVSDLHIERKLVKTRSWAKKQLGDSIALALALGIKKVAVGFEDATRADPVFMREMAQTARLSGAFRLRLADTVGIASPKQIAKCLETVTGLGLVLGVHCHNDFGMATANTLHGLDSGADWLDATILGLGERAGNSRLEEVVSYLVLQKGIQKYDLAKLRGLSTFVAQAVGRTISPQRPVLGHEIFTCETGLHLHGLLADPQLYEPYEPESIGLKRTMLIGSKVGNRMIAATLDRLELPRPATTHGLTDLTCRIRQLAREKKRVLSDTEIIGLCV